MHHVNIESKNYKKQLNYQHFYINENWIIGGIEWIALSIELIHCKILINANKAKRIRNWKFEYFPIKMINKQTKK